jgi:hypothetical protein
MAIIHSTTMSPDKLELLTSWLPDQPWYLETERILELTVAGGFRLDDPQGGRNRVHAGDRRIGGTAHRLSGAADLPGTGARWC